MQLVGATKNFIRLIRRPFISYGIIHGLLGALIAIIFLLLTLYFAQKQVPEIVILRNWTEFGIVFLGIIALGILISGLSTYFAVSKYLRLQTHHLYR
jgi:cell division transport system permease protein